jgi:hypothetical protein
MAMRLWLYEELRRWRELLRSVGLSAGDDDFILEQQHNFIRDFKACGRAMIHRHYLHELDMRHEKPEGFSFDGAVLAARRAVRDRQAA